MVHLVSASSCAVMSETRENIPTEYLAGYLNEQRFRHRKNFTALGQESNPLGSIPGLNPGYGLDNFFPTMKVLLI